MKKVLLLLLASLALSGCGTTGPQGEQGLSAYQIYCKYHPEYKGTEEEWINSYLKDGPDDTKYDVYNNYVFSEMVIDGVRGYCVTGYYGKEEKINLSIPSSYSNLPVIGISLSHSYYNEHVFYRDYIESIHFPSSIKLINWGGLGQTIDDSETKVIFDGDVKYIIGYGRGDDEFYESNLEKVYFNGTVEQFTDSNLDNIFRASDIYFKEGNEYKCKIERREEIKYILDEAVNSTEIYDVACTISNLNKEVILPTELKINYKGETKIVPVTYKRISNYYSGQLTDFVLEGNKLKYVGDGIVGGGKQLELSYCFSYRNVAKSTSINFSALFFDIFAQNKASMEGGAESNADAIINNIMNLINGESYKISLPASKFFLVFCADNSEQCNLLKYPLSTLNCVCACIAADEETSDSTDYKSAFAQFLDRHQDFFEIAGSNAYETNYYENGYLNDADIEYLETADPNNFLIPTILLIELNPSDKKGVTEVAFGARGNSVQERKQFLLDMWNHEGLFAAKQ